MSNIDHIVQKVFKKYTIGNKSLEKRFLCGARFTPEFSPAVFWAQFVAEDTRLYTETCTSKPLF